MILFADTTCKVTCDGCGEPTEAIPHRVKPEGRASAIELPRGWSTAEAEGESFHVCPGCRGADGAPFGDRRPLFEQRFAEFGMGLLTEVSLASGVPPAIGRRWAAEIRQSERKTA